MTTLHEYSHPIADTAKAFGDALDQNPEVIDRIISDVELVERDGQHAPPGEAKVRVPMPPFEMLEEDVERWDGCD